MSFTFVQKAVQIAAPEGFRDLELRLDGLLSALDWVVDHAHHVWGSAVMVGPGAELTAGHVVAAGPENGRSADRQSADTHNFLRNYGLHQFMERNRVASSGHFGDNGGRGALASLAE